MEWVEIIRILAEFLKSEVGSVSILICFLGYMIYNNVSISKGQINALNDLKEQTTEIRNLFKQQLDFQNHFINELKHDMREVKEKTSEIHLHCKESVNMIRDKIQGSSFR